MPVTRRKLVSDVPRTDPAPNVVIVSFPNQRLLTIRQTAEYLACSTWAVRDLYRRGKLTRIRLGKKFLIDRAEVDAYIERVKKEKGE